MTYKWAERLIEVYDNAGAVQSNKGKWTTVNELTDQVPAVRASTLMYAVEALYDLGEIPRECDKVLSEEDKGAVLAGLFAVECDLPLAMARHNVPYLIPGSIVTPYDSEYLDGQLTINGIEKGDKVILIDDTLASGGTMVGLIEAVEAAGAFVVDIRVVVEKLGYGGRDKVETLGKRTVKAAIGITVSDTGVVRVAEVMGAKR